MTAVVAQALTVVDVDVTAPEAVTVTVDRQGPPGRDGAGAGDGLATTTDLNAEAAARIDADATEATARAAADTAEALARAAGDNDLDARLDVIEALAPLAGLDDVAAEASTRAAADASLDARLDAIDALGALATSADVAAEAAARAAGDAAEAAARATAISDEAAARATAISAAVDALRSELLGGAPPAALDTLAELAAALTDDTDAITALTTTVAGKQDADPDLAALADLDGAALGYLERTGAGVLVARTSGDIKTALALTKSDVGLSNVPNVDATNASNLVNGTVPNARLDADVAALADLDGAALGYLERTGAGVLVARSSGDIKTALALTKSDVGLSNVPNVDATNASNLASGTVPDARLPARTKLKTVQTPGNQVSSISSTASLLAAPVLIAAANEVALSDHKFTVVVAFTLFNNSGSASTMYVQLKVGPVAGLQVVFGSLSTLSVASASTSTRKGHIYADFTYNSTAVGGLATGVWSSDVSAANNTAVANPLSDQAFFLYNPAVDNYVDLIVNSTVNNASCWGRCDYLSVELVRQ